MTERHVVRPQQLIEAPEAERVLSRRLVDLRRIVSRLKRSRVSPLQLCQSIIDDRLIDLNARQFFSELPANEKHYWISSLYACLIPSARRRRLSAYFTPPHLAQYAIQMLVDAGVKLGVGRILDPASGGAAFLVPLAERIASTLRQRGVGSAKILNAIEATLAGVEIERDLTRLSRSLLKDLLREEIKASAHKINLNIRHADALELDGPEHAFDAVIGNPPYGRIFRPSRSLLENFNAVITDGYVNLYALFIERALRWVRPGGIVCLIVPISFVGGPHFSALRKHILGQARVISIDPIDKRRELFLDVLYDVCVLLLEKKPTTTRSVHATSSLLLVEGPPRKLGRIDLPIFPSERIWALPDGSCSDELFQDGLETLDDYGYITKAGYFVWNREKERYRTGYKPRPTEVPLYWAHNIRANAKCEPYDGSPGSKRLGFVRISPENIAIIRSDAIILQRTSNRRQKRRIVATVIRQNKVPGRRGFVSENHTILILPNPSKPQTISLTMLCRLLNTAAVDGRFRRISGTVSVSTKALRVLPLPSAKEFRLASVDSPSDDDAAKVAYNQSISRQPSTAAKTERVGGDTDGE